MERGRPYRVPPGLIAILVALGVLAAGLAGYFAGHREREAAPAPETTSLGLPQSLGAVQMSLPAAWVVDDRAVRDGSVLSGLSAAAIRPDLPQSARLLAWVSTGPVNPQLLPLGRIDPASLLAAKAPTTVEFPNGQTALRYDDLRLRRRQSPLRIYVAPTTKGVVTLACPGEYLPQPCDAVATTISATGADPLPVDPDSTVADGLRNALIRLGNNATDPINVLSTAKRGATIASASNDLADAYGGAARTISGIEAPLGRATVSFDGLATRLEAVAVGYRDVAQAATAGDRDRYRKASERLNASRKELEITAAQLRRQGYDLRMPQ